MLKNPNYRYGTDVLDIPSNLHIGHFYLKRLLEFKDAKIINGQTHEEITLGEIAQQAVNVSASLTRLGVRKGDRVAICSENRIEFWGTVIGTLLSGGVLTTLNMTYTKGEITHVLGIGKPKYIVCSPLAYKTQVKNFKSQKNVQGLIVFGDDKISGTISFNDLCSQYVSIDDFLPVEVEGQNDLAFILYSSGTTGLPKGVMLTHLNCLNTFCSPPAKIQFQPVVLNVNPWFHTMGLMGALKSITSGRTLVYIPKFELDLYLRTIEKYKASVIQVVPPILVALTKIQVKYDVSSVLMIFSGAAPLREETAHAIKSVFPKALPVLQGYGMTECTLAVTVNDNLQNPKAGCVGKPMPTVVMKIVDLETRKPLGPNKEGEICVKGGIVMKGYVGKDRKEDFDEEGFFRTGDIGYYDEEGYFYIVDRLKELIKYKGYQVPPAEIEAVLLQNPSIRDAGVIGLPHSSAGEVPLAFVALQPGAKLTVVEIQQFVAERLSNPKHLRGGVRFVSEIPKNPSGKILRRQLRALLRDSKSKL